MDFFQNLNVRTKLFSAIFLIVLIFLILIFWQFSSLDKINNQVVVLSKAENSLNAIQEISTTSKHESTMLLEIIQSSEQNSLRTFFEEHNSNIRRVNTLFDTLFNDTKIVFPNSSTIGRVKINNNINDSRRIINEDLVSLFENVYSIKKLQLAVGDDPYENEPFDTEITGVNENDTTEIDEEPAIIRVEESEVIGSSRSIQLVKLYARYKQNQEKITVLFSEIHKILRDEFAKYEQITKKRVANIKLYNSVFFLIALIVTFLVLTLASRTISKPLRELEQMASQMAEGELPEHSKVAANDEIGKMAKALNILTDGLVKTSEFASEIGRGNFVSKFEPLSSKDVLGNSLLEMRKSLQSANEEENKRKIEDQERNWTTEGLALFGEILRRHTENIGLLSKDIIQNLIKYLKANQGGIFILNDSDPDNVYLELMSAYAYNREKFIKKHIKLGQGLVGGAAVEKYTIHMTDLPEEYIEIESGLGGANPNSLLIVPLKLEDTVLGVIEIASFNKFKSYEIELVERIGESIASTLSTAKINTRTAELLEQSRVQTQEMQEQDEEMRQNMEEMVAAQEDSLRREEDLKKEVSDLENMRINLVKKEKKQRVRIEELNKENTSMSSELELLHNQVNRSFESNMEPVILIDDNRKIQFFNQSAERVFEYNRTEILGKGLEIIMDEAMLKQVTEDIALYLQTGRKGLIDKIRDLQLNNKSGDVVPATLTMMDIIMKGKRNIALFIKSQGEIKKLEIERDKIKDKLMSKEFDYTTKIDILENFIQSNGLQIPIDIEAQSDLITWSDKYSIELSIIDQQHKKWIDFINILYKAYKAKAKKKEVGEHISKLLDYTDYHFGFEEKYLEDFKCGNLENHRKEHAEFVGNIKKYLKRHNNNDSNAAYKLLIYLNNWILEHIQTDDKRYVECFKLNGLS